MTRPWSQHILAILNILCFSIAINRPVYKIVLNSKGYAQFIQYDVDVPALREFTLCVWVLVASHDTDQTIFTYVGTDDKRIMRLWLDSGGEQIRISLDHGRVKSSASMEFGTHAWRDVCLSYQADYGAWALYVDAQLVLCEASPKLKGFEFPGRGRLIFGYGTSENGSPSGLSGEIYGVSMITYSTIERNTPMLNNLWNKQNHSGKNKISYKRQQQNQYIILGDLDTDEVKPVSPLSIIYHKNVSSPLAAQTSQGNIKVVPEYPRGVITSSTDDLFIDKFVNNEKYTPLNQKFKENVLKINHDLKKELTGSGTRDLPIVLEYETPPPITASTADYSANLENQKNIAMDPNDHIITISDVERPPLPDKNPKVYGQWTSSKFASSVLNYLKNTNFNMYKKPKTVPVVKLSDSYPYPSKFTYDIIRPPKNYKYNTHHEKYHNIEKRAINGPQINVEIIKTELSDKLNPGLNYLDPKFVEVTSRGEAKRQQRREKSIIQSDSKENETYESEDAEEDVEELDGSTMPLENRQAVATTINSLERHRGNNLMNILPFVKSKEYFEKNRNDDTKITETNQIYLKSLKIGNRWHNVQSYNNDYTPKLIMNSESAKSTNNNHKSFTKPALYKPSPINDIQSIIDGRLHAKEVSNQANQKYMKVPISELKYSPATAHTKITSAGNIAVQVVGDDGDTQKKSQHNFNKHVKLGNALNERFIIGYDEQNIKNTFLGGDDAIPDINKHRSKWNSNYSIEPRICRNAQLYVLENESIGISKILSPLEQKNIAIEFVVHNYKECSMNDLFLKKKIILLIDWVKTPLKLFGGASPEKTTDLCGFFFK